MQATQDTKTANKPLSAKAVEALKPGSPIRADVGENTGLRVKCGATGLKTFFYRYKSPETGKLTQIKIGNYPDVSLAHARVELEKLKVIRRSGVCPKADRDRKVEAEKAEKLAVQQAQLQKSFTVTSLIELYLTEFIEDRVILDRKDPSKKKRIAGARKPKGQSETRRTLYGDAVRVLGDKSASKITRKDVINLIMGIVNRGANVQAGNVLRELSAAYEYAIGLERFPDDFANPALLAKAGLKQARVKLTSTKGKRVLSDKELARVLSWLPQSGFSQAQKSILHFTLLTGCRTGEVCEARWHDIDLSDATWHMRDSKNGSERYVQLSTQAITFLKGLDSFPEVYLFPSSRTGLPVQQKSLTEIKWQLRNADSLPNRRKFSEVQRWPSDMGDWSPHDLRRTVRTGLSRLGCPSEVAEAVLGHSRKGIEGTYDLHSYEEECKDWLQRWAGHLDTLLGV